MKLSEFVKLPEPEREKIYEQVMEIVVKKQIETIEKHYRQTGKGTSNFVVFDEDLIKILSRE